MLMLGKVLLDANAITEDELDTALENHVLHGVKLGTCLVEMGYVPDDILARCLGKQTGYAFLSKEQLAAAAAQNLSLISRDVTKKHRLIPVGEKGSVLRIATDDYLSAKKQAEIEKIIGRQIEPVAVSGYAVDCFLEQAFGIPRPGRFIAQFSKAKKTVEPLPVESAMETEEATSVVIDGVEWKLFGEANQYDEPVDVNDQIFYGTLKPDSSPHTVSEVAELLSHAKSRDDVAKTVLDFVSNFTGTAALVIARNGFVYGWSASVNKMTLPDFETFSAPLATLPDLQQCIAIKKPCSGRPVPSETGLFRRALGYEGGVIAYFPVFIQQRVAAVLLCDESGKLDHAETAEVCKKASYALEILILRSKLLG